MPDNKNENNDSLFTQMFGLESEIETKMAHAINNYDCTSQSINITTLIIQ